MIEALEETNVAMIGIARPLVLRPDLPNRIKNGTYNDIELPRLITKVKVLDQKLGGFLGLSYYEQQLHRLGKGLPLVMHTNAWRPLGFMIANHRPAVLKPRRR